MGYLEGFKVTFTKLFKGTETGRTVTVLSSRTRTAGRSSTR